MVHAEKQARRAVRAPCQGAEMNNDKMAREDQSEPDDSAADAGSESPEEGAEAMAAAEDAIVESRSD
jgi:hypothetical protein